MADANTVIIISDRQEVINQISQKLVLLRNLDKIKSSSIDEALNLFNSYNPNVVILHCDNNNIRSLNLIKQIKSQDIYKNLPILLINENFLKYENRKDGLTAQDLVTIYNFVQQYNKSIDYDDAQIVKIDGKITVLGIETFDFSSSDVNTNDFLEKCSYDSNANYYKYKIQITSKSEITGKVNGIKFQKT